MKENGKRFMNGTPPQGLGLRTHRGMADASFAQYINVLSFAGNT